MHLEREADAFGVEHVDDRAPALGELLVASLDRVEVVRREGVEQVPDRRAGEPVDHRDAEGGRGARGVLHPLRGPAAHALRVAVPPHLRRQDRPVARVDRVADGLPDEVRSERPAAETVLLEERPRAFA